MTLAEGMKCTKEGCHSTVIKGTMESSFVMPCNGRRLEGESIQHQIDTWVIAGVIEADAGESVKSFLKTTTNEKLQLLNGFYFCLLGAGSAMCPFEVLMKLGATVIAVDLECPNVWKRLVNTARKSSGTLIIPTHKPQTELTTDDLLFENSGTNMVTHAPEIANWLIDNFTDRKLMIGGYTYLKTDMFLRVSVAMDAIIQSVVQRRDVHPVIAYQCTPTNVHTVNMEAYTESVARFENRTTWKRVISMIKERFLKQASCMAVATEEKYNMTFQDHLSLVQGPVYALSKRIQIWRAILARRAGCIVSSNVAPSTATHSVLQNKSMALAFKVFHLFDVEVFEEDTTNALMTAILLDDMMNHISPANPDVKLDHPLQLQAKNACHGGAQRCGEGLGTISEAAAVAYTFCRPTAFIFYLIIISILYHAWYYEPEGEQDKFEALVVNHLDDDESN